MIHYHGLPITPEQAAISAIGGGHAFVSFRYQDQIRIAMECAQSFAVDNGAFSAWKAGKPVNEWAAYYEWVESICRHPAFDWAIIPDVIDGSELDNDLLIDEYQATGLPGGVPVWHLHESLERLGRLAHEFPRVAIGSSGEYANTKTSEWWARMFDAMRTVCDDKGRPSTKLHGLRMLDPFIIQAFPLSSADSTNIAKNVGIDKRWTGAYAPPSAVCRARILRERIESVQSAPEFSKKWMVEQCLLV